MSDICSLSLPFSSLLLHFSTSFLRVSLHNGGCSVYERKKNIDECVINSAQQRRALTPSRVSVSLRPRANVRLAKVKTTAIPTRRNYATVPRHEAKASHRPNFREIMSNLSPDDLDGAVLNPRLLRFRDNLKEQQQQQQQEQEATPTPEEPQNALVVSSPLEDGGEEVSDEDLSEVLHYLDRGNEPPPIHDDRWLIKKNDLAIQEVLNIGRHTNIVRGTFSERRPLKQFKFIF